MTWQVLHRTSSPIQATLSLVNDDKAATPTTNYHEADKLARDTMGPCSLAHKGESLSGQPIRAYVSQAY